MSARNPLSRSGKNLEVIQTFGFWTPILIHIPLNMHIRSCIVLWVTFSSATRWGQRGQLTPPPPEMSRGARSDLNFFVFFCGLPAVKLFRRGLQSLKLLTRRAHNNMKLPERAPNWSRETTCKKNMLPNRALHQIGPTYRSGLPL